MTAASTPDRCRVLRHRGHRPEGRQQVLEGDLLAQRHLDDEHHVQPAFTRRLGRVERDRAGGDEVAQPLAGEGGPLAVLVEEQALAPGPAGGEGVARVVDHGGAGALAGGDDRQHGRVALVGLVVEDHRVELGDALLRDRQEGRLGADEDVRVAADEERARRARPTSRDR